MNAEPEEMAKDEIASSFLRHNDDTYCGKMRALSHEDQ
jgi:hypothetical protein